MEAIENDWMNTSINQIKNDRKERLSMQQSLEEMLQENNQEIIKIATNNGYNQALMDAARLVTDHNLAIAILNLAKS